MLKALEEARNKKLIGQSLQAKVVLKAQGALYDFLKGVEEVLSTVFITSQVVLEKKDSGALEAEVLVAEGDKCERCWTYSDTVGKAEEHPTLCKRCSSVLGSAH